MGFAAANIPNATFEACQKIALQRRSYGYHWAFSPVVDLNLNFRNPITNVRSFGDDIEKVISHQTHLLTASNIKIQWQPQPNISLETE